MQINLLGIGTASGGFADVAKSVSSAADATSGLSFAQHLADKLNNAESAAINAVSGNASLQETVATVLEAERTLTAAVAIRDKIVSAYLELSRMQV